MLAGAALIALSASIVIPLPFTPVPVTGQTLAFLAATGVIYLCGLPWLACFTGWKPVLELGLYPFLIGDGVKFALALAIVHPLARRAGENATLFR